MKYIRCSTRGNSMGIGLLKQGFSQRVIIELTQDIVHQGINKGRVKAIDGVAVEGNSTEYGFLLGEDADSWELLETMDTFSVYAPNASVDPIIEEARQRYPVGTKFHPVHVGYPGEQYCIVTNDQFFWDGSYLYACLEHGDTTNGYSNDPKYGNTSYNRIVYSKSQNKWAKILDQKPEDKQPVEVFPGIYKGDIVVSLSDVHPYRSVGDMFEVLLNLLKEHFITSRIQVRHTHHNGEKQHLKKLKRTRKM